MSWASATKTMIAAAAIGLAAPVLAGVVVKSSGPSAGDYPVGKKVADNDRITLREGDQVTVLNTSGTRVLKGPGTYRAGARGAATRVRFSQLTRQGAASRVRTGAARAGEGEVRSPNLWYVDVTRAGRMCMTSFDNVVLWRPKTEGEETYILRRADSDYHHHVAFGDGVMVRRLDDERMPLEAGNDYRISGPGGAAAAVVTFTLVEASPDNPEAMADLLIQNGCEIQLDLLAQTLETSAS